jgi:NTE family protein
MKIGVVFAGGGGKGSYQIGAWKAFHEFGLDKKIIAVAGTSVGAINAALFMQGDFQRAENAWLRISQGKILSLSAKKIINALVSLGIPLPIKSVLLINQLCHHGFFSRSGLLELINESLTLSAVSVSPIKGYAACLQTPPNMKITYFTFNNASPDRIISILLASSAIPAIFRPIEIDDHRYIDGGLPVVGDNIPIQPLYDHGCDFIFVIHLGV